MTTSIPPVQVVCDAPECREVIHGHGVSLYLPPKKMGAMHMKDYDFCDMKCLFAWCAAVAEKAAEHAKNARQNPVLAEAVG